MRKKFFGRALALFLLFVLGACAAQPGVPSVSDTGSLTESDKNSQNNSQQGEAMQPLTFTKEYFAGKTVVVYGDSITAGAMTSGERSTWIYKMKEELGFVYASFAVSGSLLTYANAVRDGRGSGASYIVANEATNKIADYAIVFYGANDYTHGVKIGENEESADSLEQISSFKQGIKWAVKNLRTHNPQIKIVFFTPLYRNDVPVNGQGLKISAYGQAVKDLSGDLGYYYVDLFDLFTPENLGKDSMYSPDQLHPNDAGQRLLFEYIMSRPVEYAGKK